MFHVALLWNIALQSSVVLTVHAYDRSNLRPTCKGKDCLHMTRTNASHLITLRVQIATAYAICNARVCAFGERITGCHRNAGQALAFKLHTEDAPKARSS